MYRYGESQWSRATSLIAAGVHAGTLAGGACTDTHAVVFNVIILQEYCGITLRPKRSVMLEGTRVNTPPQMARIFDIAKDTVLFLLLSCYYILESLFWTLVPNAIRPVKSLKGDVVLVTGGGGGVGRQVALKLARLGAKVVVWDIDAEGLQKTCTDVTVEGYTIASYVVDLADRAAVYATAEKVKKEVSDKQEHDPPDVKRLPSLKNACTTGSIARALTAPATNAPTPQELPDYLTHSQEHNNPLGNCYLAAVFYQVGKVDILINNAGTVFGETLLELTDSAIETTYKVNILSHYWTVKSFLPDMIKTGKGHIVTVGSVAGLLGTYRCTDYSGTKFATVGFHESLFTELRAHGHNTIHATLVCPYYINTGMFNGVTPRLMPMLEPDYVAETMIDSIRKNEVNCVMPGSVRYLLPLKCLLPAKMCWDLMHRVMKGPQSMMEFKKKPKVAGG